MSRELRGVGEGLPVRDASGGPPPPLVLGRRGAPLVAPENTLASLRTALDYGLDGFEYDLRACAGGDAVLLRDEVLSRTTDGSGFVRDRSLSELFRLDAGGWFSKSFVGEPLPVLEEVLELVPDAGAKPVVHWIDLHDAELVETLAERLDALEHPPTVRVATPSRELCLRLRDAGLSALLVASETDDEIFEFLRRERIAGLALPASAPQLVQDAPALECWRFGLDSPGELLAACRRGDTGYTTAEPQRALAARELARLAPEDEGPFPLRVPALYVGEGLPPGEGRGGEWRGRWRVDCKLRNPFPFDVRVACQLLVRRGAFEVDGLPLHVELSPGEELAIPFELSGGSWSPGGDPLFAALFEWGRGPGRSAGRLLLDAPLERVRTLVADVVTRRVRMLRESPGQAEATMTVRRRGAELLLSIENAGGLSDPHALVHLAGRVRRGGRGMAIRLPSGFDVGEEGTSFSCGFEGRTENGSAERPVLRRWAGGLPDAPDSGAPGRLVPH